MSGPGINYARPDWQLRSEPLPSLVRHFLPLFGTTHRMNSTCWCQPFLQNEHAYTVVIHHQFPGGDERWPLRSQLP